MHVQEHKRVLLVARHSAGPVVDAATVGGLARCAAYLEVPWHPIGQLLGVLRNLVVEIDGGGVLQELVLLVHSLHHVGMAVAHADRDDASESLRCSSWCNKRRWCIKQVG